MYIVLTILKLLNLQISPCVDHVTKLWPCTLHQFYLIILSLQQKQGVALMMCSGCDGNTMTHNCLCTMINTEGCLTALKQEVGSTNLKQNALEQQLGLFCKLLGNWTKYHVKLSNFKGVVTQHIPNKGKHTCDSPIFNQWACYNFLPYMVREWERRQIKGKSEKDRRAVEVWSIVEVLQLVLSFFSNPVIILSLCRPVVLNLSHIKGRRVYNKCCRAQDRRRTCALKV